ncbi:MAG: glycine cleavage system aminomethyltransferase GcvT [bacterium]|nr:MAG: glycine cleavage system aminomethyltransferase GcvT [bacterium]
MTPKKTPLYEAHVAAGGKIVEFAGFLMPVTFEGIVAEHNRVRTTVGLFDVSHMGEIELSGTKAVEFADYVVTNSVAKLVAGQVCYTVACNEDGKVLDDLLVYRLSDERVLLVVNAVNTEKIHDHLIDTAPSGCTVDDRTDRIGQIAVQGPRSLELLLASGFGQSHAEKLKGLAYYNFFTFERDGEEVILSRTGYTGEQGYEIYLPAGQALGLWNELLGAGKGMKAAPIGLGARDTLRFEASYCLYGHEIDEETSPLEAGLSWLVKFKKGDFIGRKALASEKERGPARTLVGLEIEGRMIARQGFTVLYNGESVGTVTSGTFAPALGKSLAMALIQSAAAGKGEFTIDIRGKMIPAMRVGIPFYKSRSKD